MKLHYIDCICGKRVVKKVWNQTTCSRKCSLKKYNQSEKGKATSKRTYEKIKDRCIISN